MEVLPTVEGVVLSEAERKGAVMVEEAKVEESYLQHTVEVVATPEEAAEVILKPAVDILEAVATLAAEAVIQEEEDS